MQLWSKDKLYTFLESWLTSPYPNYLHQLNQVHSSIASTVYKDPCRFCPVKNEWNYMQFLEHANYFSQLFRTYYGWIRAEILHANTQLFEEIYEDQVKILAQHVNSQLIMAIDDDLKWLFHHALQYQKKLQLAILEREKSLMSSFQTTKAENTQQVKQQEKEEQEPLLEQRNLKQHNYYQIFGENLIKMDNLINLAKNPLFKAKIDHLRHVYSFVQKHCTFQFWRNLDKLKLIIIFLSSQNLLHKIESNYNILESYRIYQTRQYSRIFHRDYKLINFKCNSIKRRMSEDDTKANKDLIDQVLKVTVQDKRELENVRQDLVIRINMALKKDADEARLLMQKEEFKLLTKEDLAYLNIEERLMQLDLLKYQKKMLEDMARGQLWKENQKKKEAEEEVKK